MSPGKYSILQCPSYERQGNNESVFFTLYIEKLVQTVYVMCGFYVSNTAVLLTY